MSEKIKEQDALKKKDLEKVVGGIDTMKDMKKGTIDPANMQNTNTKGGNQQYYG